MAGFHSVFRRGIFRDQVIFVTGGGSGIGRCTAHELAHLGATVVIAGRRRGALEQTVAEIAEQGGRADAIQLDIRDDERVEAAFEELLERHGRLDGVFNNAGGTFGAPAAEMKPKGFRAVTQLNLSSAFTMCRAAYQHFMGENGGVIVNMLGDFSTGFPTVAAASAAGMGVENLSRSLALEWCTAGIRVNSVAPGYILSSGMVAMDRHVQDSAAEVMGSLPLGRLGTESEISAAAVFLLSPAAAYITGETITIAGGSQLQKPRPMPVGGMPRTRPFNGFHLRPNLAGSLFEEMM